MGLGDPAHGASRVHRSVEWSVLGTRPIIGPLAAGQTRRRVVQPRPAGSPSPRGSASAQDGALGPRSQSGTRIAGCSSPRRVGIAHRSWTALGVLSSRAARGARAKLLDPLLILSGAPRGHTGRDIFS